MAIRKGTEDDDDLKGTKKADALIGLEGDDTMTGRNGNDTFFGSIGSDTYDGGRGRNDVSFARVDASVAVGFFGTIILSLDQRGQDKCRHRGRHGHII